MSMTESGELIGLYGESPLGVAGIVAGPRQIIQYTPAVPVELYFQWVAYNPGATERLASLRLNLQIDSSTGPHSQYIFEVRGGVVFQDGGMAPALEVFRDFPKPIPPNSYDFLNLVVRFTSDEVRNQQNPPFPTIFRWWLFELTMWDVALDGLAGGDSRFQVNEWFKLVD